MGQRKLNTLSHEQKREACKDKRQNPTLMNKEIQEWILLTFKLVVHDTTIGRFLKDVNLLLANWTVGSTKRNKVCVNPSIGETLYA